MPHFTKNSYFKDNAFPITIHHLSNQEDVDAHGHDFHELVIVNKGRGIHFTETEEYWINEGDIFVIHPQRSHGYRNTEELEIVNILYFPEQLNLSASDLREMPGYHILFILEPKLRNPATFHNHLSLCGEPFARVVNIVKSMEHELDYREPGFKSMVSGYFWQLAAFLARCHETSQTKPTTSDSILNISQLLSYIEQNYRQKLNLEDMADITGLSKHRLIKEFNQALDKTPIEYLLHTRIGKARKLLSSPDIRISEAAFKCGFSDSNYFSRQFKKITGQTPREFRYNNT